MITWRTVVVASAVPLLLGGIGAVVVLLVQPGVRWYAAGSVAVLAVVLGALVSAVVATALAVRRRLAGVARAAAASGSARAAAAAQADHRRFLLRLDHELKNPLTAIRAALVNAEAAGRTDAAGAQALSSIAGQAGRLGRLTAGLRKIAEVEAQDLTVAEVDVVELVDEVVATAGEQFARAVRVTVPSAPWPPPPVPGDHDLLFLAVFNLVANALKYSAASDTVEVRVVDDPPWVRVEVADTGIGIPPDEADTVWEELARGRAAQGTPGSGLGLSLVRAVVARHAGTVALRSRPSQGTVVTLRLPVAAGTGPGPSAPSGSAPSDVADLRHRDDRGATGRSYAP